MDRKQLKQANILLRSLEEAESNLEKLEEWKDARTVGMSEQVSFLIPIPPKPWVPAEEAGIPMKLPYTFIHDCLTDEVAKAKDRLYTAGVSV